MVTGATGLLGTEVTAEARRRGHEVAALGHADLDVTDGDATQRVVSASAPEALIHCAAYTAVDRAEAEARRAEEVNREGSRHVAAAAGAVGAALVYVSTDYVFDGEKGSPYLPDDPAAPLSVYGRTKHEGEVVVRGLLPNALIVRTSWLYGRERGFAPAILRRAAQGSTLRVVVDQRGRPTWAPNAATAIVELLELDARGVFHVADGGDCTWLELAREALKVKRVQVPVTGISTRDFGAAAPRPAYSVLDLRATEEMLGREMMDWRRALATCLCDQSNATREATIGESR